MPATYGAVPEQLTALGNTLKNQVGPIDSVISTVTSVLAGTSWDGPARDQFEEEWNNTFRATLGRLKEAFEAAGNGCVTRSAQLATLMGR
jgi:hypothetical protein